MFDISLHNAFILCSKIVDNTKNFSGLQIRFLDELLQNVTLPNYKNWRWTYIFRNASAITKKMYGHISRNKSSDQEWSSPNREMSCLLQTEKNRESVAMWNLQNSFTLTGMFWTIPHSSKLLTCFVTLLNFQSIWSICHLFINYLYPTN